MIQEGTLLAGKYRVERLLGAGGMGYVVAAVHEQLDQRVAVKLLATELWENKDAATRFLREARAAVRIRSEHVARVLDVDELENGEPYMVMEFLSGQDLAHELDEQDRFEPRIAIDYLLQVCEAVAEAHSLGVIHRDLKPANLFLTRRADGSPLVKVLDFGISKAITPETGTSGQSLTAPQSLLGSPAYMSPEQVRRPKTVDIRTDIWSLGTILYEFLTGEPPFRGETPLSVLAAVVSDPMPSIREKNPTISPELEGIVAKCLEKEPDDRYQTIAELAQALAPHAPSAALSSISRISGILRSSLQPKDPTSTTLRSASGPPPGDPASERTEEAVAVPGASEDKRTQTDFGGPKSDAGRPRWKTWAAIAAVFGIFAMGIVLLRPSAVDRVPAAESAHMTVTAGNPLPSVNPPSVPVTEQAIPQMLTAHPASIADGGPTRVRPVESTKAKTSKLSGAAPVKAPLEAPPAAHPGAKVPAARPMSDDPLEGRR